MHAKSLLLACGAVAAASALAGCGSSQSTTTTRTSPRRQRSSAAFGARAGGDSTNVVYEWGRYGGADPGDASGHGPGNHGWSPTYGGWYRGGPSHIVRTPTPVIGIDGTVRQVASSNSDGYGLTTSGRVYAWGAGAQGELGNGTTPTLSRTAVRVHFPAGVVIDKLADPMPFDGGMAIDTHGRVWAWGNDQARQFCQAHGADLETPVRVPLLHVTLAAGAQMHAVYDAGGKVVSCGLSDFGQLGDGATGRSSTSGRPVAVEGLPAGRVVALTSSYGDAGALLADGSYYDWGYNRGGQLGDGTTIEHTTAVRVALPGPVRRVFQGGSMTDNGQTIALLSRGQLWEWGSGRYGQLGDGRRVDRPTPFRLIDPPGVRFVAVHSGGGANYAIDRRGGLWAWGPELRRRTGRWIHGDTDGEAGARPARRRPTVEYGKCRGRAREAPWLAGASRPFRQPRFGSGVNRVLDLDCDVNRSVRS
jgi:alpha-tubulin suppressor-like RCC1 family protein